MFSLFHILALLGVIAGTVTGAVYGWQWFGLLGLIVGAIGGYIAGAGIGQLPLVAAVMFARRTLAPMSSAELRDYLHADDCQTPNLVLLELQSRDEDISIERPYLYSLLTSDNGNDRANALAAMNSVFPELVAMIPNFSPYSSIEDCRREAEPIRLALNPDCSSESGTRPSHTANVESQNDG